MQVKTQLTSLLFEARPLPNMGISAIVLDQGPGLGVETGLVLYCDEDFVECCLSRFTFSPGGTQQPPADHPADAPWHAPRIKPSVRLWDMRGAFDYHEAMRQLGRFCNSQANEYY